MEQKRPENVAAGPGYLSDAVDEERSLEDEGRGWCGVRTYITGPQAVVAGKSACFQSNVHIDADEGCRKTDVDEVSWTITGVPDKYQNWIHIRDQATDGCRVAVEHGVPSGTQFMLHATPKAHGLGKGTNARVACQVNKADAQLITVS